MIRRRIYEILLYCAGPLAIFLTAPILARGLGPAGRGELGVAQSVASFALALGTLGQAEVLLADRRNGNGNLRVSGNIAMFGGVSSAIIAAISLFCMGIDMPVIIAAVILIPVLSQSQLWRSVAISKQALRAPALNNFYGAVFRVILLGLLAITPFLSPSSAMMALQISAAIAAFISLRTFARRSTRSEPQASKKGTYRSNLVRGLPLIAFSLLTSITLRSGIIALQVFSDPVSVGIYAGASSLSMAVLSISGAFKSRVQAAVFLPNSRLRVQRELILVTGVGVAGASVAILSAPWIVRILLGPEFVSAIPLLKILALSCIGLLLLDSIHGLLAAMGKRQAMVIVGAIGASSTVISLVFLVPTLGATGAAISSVISCSIASICGWFIIRPSLD